MSKKLTTLQDRLSAWADDVQERAETMAPRPERDALLKRVAQVEEATNLYNWINSPELQPPK